MTDQEQIQFVMDRVWYDPKKKIVHFPSESSLYVFEDVSDTALAEAMRLIRIRDEKANMNPITRWRRKRATEARRLQ